VNIAINIILKNYLFFEQRLLSPETSHNVKNLLPSAHSTEDGRATDATVAEAVAMVKQRGD